MNKIFGIPEKPETDTERFERYKNKLIAIIHAQLSGCKIYLFGSRARGTHKAGADIDLALDAGSIIELSKILKIYSDIDQTTIPVSVDLVDFNNTSAEMRSQIITEGVLWASCNLDFCCLHNKK